MKRTSQSENCMHNNVWGCAEMLPFEKLSVHEMLIPLSVTDVPVITLSLWNNKIIIHKKFIIHNS